MKSPQQLYLSFIEIPLCACGCGQPVKWSNRYRRWNVFITGHNSCLESSRETASKRTKMLWRDLIYITKQRLAWTTGRRELSGMQFRAFNASQPGQQLRQQLINQSRTPESRKASSDRIKRYNNSPEGKMNTLRLNTDPNIAAIRDKWRASVGGKATLARVRSCIWQNRYRNGKNFSNTLEAKFDELTPDCVDYVGDKRWWRRVILCLPTGEYIQQYKNPDFKVKNQNKVIEVWGDYWHRNEFPRDLIEAYDRENVECLIIWESEIKTNPKAVLEKVSRFIDNTKNGGG